MYRIDRRTYLSLLVGGTVVVAGCTGSPDENPTTEETTDANSSRNATDVDDSDGEDEPAESTESSTDYGVGDRLEDGDLHLLVSACDRVDDVVDASTGDVLEADDGAAFAVVDLALKHAGDETVVAVDERVAVELGDETGETYEPATIFESKPFDPTESRLAPGEVARGDLVYEIDDDAEGLVLELEFEGEREAFIVDLETETEPAAVLEQDLTDDALSFGQGVETAGIEITVTTLEHGNNLGGFMQSDEGHEIVAVGLVVENGSGRERTISSEQVRLTDEFGRSHDEAPGVVRALEGFDGDVLTDGDEHDGKIAYQIEEGLAELYWVFDFAAWDEDERVIWALR